MYRCEFLREQIDGVPTGIRTPVTAVKGRCPRPLDDGDPDFLSSFYGGGKRDRTADLLHAMQALSQLSYTPASKEGRIIGITLVLVKGLSCFFRDKLKEPLRPCRARSRQSPHQPPASAPGRSGLRVGALPAWAFSSRAWSRFP